MGPGKKKLTGPVSLLRQILGAIRCRRVHLSRYVINNEIVSLASKESHRECFNTLLHKLTFEIEGL
jgi:hypothetical protein